MTRQSAWVFSLVAIVMMLCGVALIFTGSSSVLAIGIITAGIALVAVVANRRGRGHAHP